MCEIASCLIYFFCYNKDTFAGIEYKYKESQEDTIFVGSDGYFKPPLNEFAVWMIFWTKNAYKNVADDAKLENKLTIEGIDDRDADPEVKMADDKEYIEVKKNDGQDYVEVKQNIDKDSSSDQCYHTNWNLPAASLHEQQLRNYIYNMENRINLLTIQLEQAEARNVVLEQTCAHTKLRYDIATSDYNNTLDHFKKELNKLKRQQMFNRGSEQEQNQNMKHIQKLKPMKNGNTERYDSMYNFILCCYVKQRYRRETEDQLEKRS